MGAEEILVAYDQVKNLLDAQRIMVKIATLKLMQILRFSCTQHP